MKKAAAIILVSVFCIIGYQLFRTLFPQNSDPIRTSDLIGKWKRTDINREPASCQENHIEYLNDSEMVIVSGALRVRSKYSLQDSVEGAYAIAKREFKLTGEYDCTGTFIDSVKSRHFTIGRWILWRKGKKLRQYIEEDRTGKYIEFVKIQ